MIGKLWDSGVFPCIGLEKPTFMDKFERFKIGISTWKFKSSIRRPNSSIPDHRQSESTDHPKNFLLGLGPRWHFKINLSVYPLSHKSSKNHNTGPISLNFGRFLLGGIPGIKFLIRAFNAHYSKKLIPKISVPKKNLIKASVTLGTV